MTSNVSVVASSAKSQPPSPSSIKVPTSGQYCKKDKAFKAAVRERKKKNQQKIQQSRDLKYSNFECHSGMGDYDFMTFSDVDHCDKIENLLLLVVGVCKAESVATAAIHILTYVKTHFKGRSIVSLLDISNILNSFVDKEVEDDLHCQSGVFVDLMGAFKSAQENWGLFKKSSCFRHLMSIFSLVVSIGLFPSVLKIGDFSINCFHAFKLKAIDFQKDTGSVIEALISTAYFFVSRGFLFFQTGDFGVFVDDLQLNNLDKEYAILVGSESLITTGQIHLMDEHQVEGIQSVADYDLRIKQLISNLEDMKRLESVSYLKKLLDDKICRLYRIKYDLIKMQVSNHFRECPYSFMISGSSSIGKTVLNNLLCSVVAKANNIPYEEKHKAVINEMDKFDSDIHSHTTIITLDDFGNMKPDKSNDPPTRRIIDLVNNVTKSAVKADLNEKGSVIINPKIVSLTTNTSDLHSQHFSAEPVSIMRRMRYIIVPLLRRTHTDECGGLDHLAYAKNKDAWTFDVYKVKIQLARQGNPKFRQADGYTLEPIRKAINVYQLIDAIRLDSVEHFMVQRKIVQEYRVNMNVDCNKCGYPSMICNCPHNDKVVETVGELDFEFQGGIHIDNILHDIHRSWDQFLFNIKNKFLRILMRFALWYAHLIYLKETAHNKTNPLQLFISRANLDIKKLYYRCLDEHGSIKQIYNKHWKALAVAALGSSAVMLYFAMKKMRQYCAFELHGNTPVLPEEEVVQENVWKKVSLEPLPRSVSSVGVTVEQLDHLISASLGILRVDIGGDLCSSCNIIPLRNNYWLAPKHMFPLDKEYNINISFTSRKKLTRNFTGIVGPTVWFKIDNTDYIILQIVFAGDQINLLRFFPEIEDIRSNGCYSLKYKDFRSEKQDMQVMEIRTITPIHNITVEGISYRGCRYKSQVDTFRGMCMAVATTMAHSPCIAGFHLAGSGKIGILVPISRTTIEEAISVMSGRGLSVHCSGTLELDMYGVNYGFSQMVHFRSPVNFLDDTQGVQPSVVVFGSHDLGRTSYKSAVVETFISQSLTRATGVANAHGPPPTKEVKKYWHKDLDLISHDTVVISPELLLRSYKDLIGSLDPQHDKALSQLRKVPDDANIAGLDAVYGMDGLLLSTSMGWPLNAPKRKYFIPSSEKVSGITRPLIMPGFLAEHLREAEKIYLSGERCYPIMRTVMKDEPTKKGKDKRRLFQASPCWYVILLRRYFLPILIHIQKNRLSYCTAVGANAHSSEWDDIAKHMSRFGSNRYLAGDYSSFDKKIPAIVLRAAFEYLFHMMRKSIHYSSDDFTIMQGLMTDLLYPVLEYDGVLLQVFTSHCSGNSLTVILNNIVNQLYMRMAYFSLYDRLGKQVTWSFCDRVNMLVYGDDNIAEIHNDEVYFNHTTCSVSLARMGIVYTMADKEAESQPYITIHDISFLKRKFRFDTDLNRFVAPLEMASIYKSLHNMMRQKKMEMCERELVSNNIRAAFKELSFHGREIYDHHAPKIYDVVVEHELCGLVGEFNTYDQFLDDYIFKNSFEMDDELCDSDHYFELQSAIEYNSHSCGGISTVLTKRPKGYFQSSTWWALCSLILLYINFPINHQCLCTTKSILHSKATTIVLPGKLNPEDLQLQSGREVFSIAHTDVKHQNVSFNAVAPGYEASVSQGVDSSYDIVSDTDNSLGQFLSRPVLLQSLDLSIGSSFNGFTNSLNPWQEFINEATVAKKLSNFSLLRGCMRIKFELNATPFQFGKIMVTYDVYEATLPGDIPRADIAPNQANYVIPSQRMKVILDPSSSLGAEMVLPFFFPEEFIELHELNTAQDFGILRFWSLAPFGASNGSIDPLNLKIYGHMENVTLAMPTFFPQAGYETGIISKPATAVAAVAKQLVVIPWLTPYAKATEYAASAVAKIAMLFGYSKPTNVSDETRIVRYNFSNMATANGLDTVQKLAMDGKNELSIDPRLVGLSGKDEMAVLNIAGIESYLYNFSWGGQAAGDLLTAVRVNPIHYRYVDTETPRYYLTASAAICNAFAYWKGSMKFRFVVNSSNFHRGRLKIVYEPKNKDLPFDPFLNTNYAHIVDLADSSDFTICVGWGQSRMYQGVGLLNPEEVYSNTNVVPVYEDLDNGRIYVYVVNPLRTSSDEPPNIQISVFTSMCDDLDVAVPNMINYNDMSPFEPQSGIEANGDATFSGKPADQPSHDSELVQMSNECFMDNSNLIYFGEKVVSLRSLIKRYVHLTSEAINVANGTSPVNFIMTRWRMFGCPGYDDQGMHLRLTGRYNYCNWSYVTFFKLCYAGWRGSVRIKATVDSSRGTGNGTASFGITETRAIVNNIFTGTNNFSNVSRGTVPVYSTSGRGCQMADFTVKPTLDVELPYFVNRRFSPGRRTNQLTVIDENIRIFGRVPANNLDANTPIVFNIFHAGGEDLSFHYWMGPPILYRVNTLPEASGANPYPVPA